MPREARTSSAQWWRSENYTLKGLAAEAYGDKNFWGLSYCDGFTGYNVGASGAWNYFPTANARCVRN